MKVLPLPESGHAPNPQYASVRASQTDIFAEILFIAAWLDGLIPNLGAYQRIRQFHSANPHFRIDPASISTLRPVTAMTPDAPKR